MTTEKKKSSLYTAYETDSELEKDGTWFQVGAGDVEFKMARAGGANEKYSKMLTRKTKPLRRQIQAEVLDEEVARHLMMEVFVTTVMKDWRGNITDRDGNPMGPFTREKCPQLFTDLPDLFSECQELAGKAAAYRKHVLEADQGN